MPKGDNFVMTEKMFDSVTCPYVIIKISAPAVVLKKKSLFG